MKATAELQMIPLGQGVSVRAEVKQVVDLLSKYNFIIETHAAGTNIEGDLSEILSAVEEAHKLLHDQGCAHLLSYLKLETRTDKIPTLAGKKL